MDKKIKSPKERLEERNQILEFYYQYQKSCHNKHERFLPFKRWLKEVYNPPKGCTKCQKIKRTLIQKLK